MTKEEELKLEFNKKLCESYWKEYEHYSRENEIILKEIATFYKNRNILSNIGEQVAKYGRIMELNEAKMKIIAARANCI